MRQVWTAVLFVDLAITFATYPAPAQSQREPAKQITFTGKVVDAQGQPIAGAKVRFYEMTLADTRYLQNATLAAESTTRADGAFSFAAGAGSHDYRNGYIIAEKQGLALGLANWDMRHDQELDIKLGQAKELAGLVVDQNGKPVSDAEVSILILRVGKREERVSLGRELAPKLLTVITDTTGRFAFTNVPAQATAEFLVKKPARATVSTFDPEIYRGEVLQFSPGQADIRLTQPEEAKIEGIVVDKNTGKPAGCVKLMVTQDRNPPLYGQESIVNSKEDGTFSINALCTGRHILQLAAPTKGLADWVAEPVEAITEPDKTTRGVKVELSKGGLLEVVVTEAGSNQPLDRASISIRDEKNKEWLSADCDKDGIARIRLVPGQYQISGVYKQGFTSDRRQETVTIEEGATKRVGWTLSEAPKVSGVVRDADGKPVEGVKFSILPASYEEVSSDSQGKFEVVWDRRGWPGEDTTFCLVARHKQRNLAAAVEISEGTKTLDIKLEPGVGLVGKVADPNGKAIAGARVTVMIRVSNWGSSLSRRQTEETDGNGNFQVKAVPAGRKYSIYASAEGYGDNRTEAQADNAVDNQLDVGTLTLPVANLSVSGRVVDTEGNPVPHTSIESSGFGDGQPSNRSTYADGQGNFTLEGVCAGQVNIRADVERDGKRLTARVITDGGATGIKIVVREGQAPAYYIGGKSYQQKLQSGKVIAGVAVDEKGAPVAGVPVGVCCHKKKDEKGRFSWTFSSFATLSDTTDQQGRFAIELEEDGEYNLRFSPDKYAAVIEYDVPVGKKDLKVTLPEGGTVTGCLMRMEKGQKVPIPNAEIKVEQTDRASYTHLGFDRDRTTVTDSQGRFRFEHLQTKIRPRESMSQTQWEYAPRVWQIVYGSTSKTITFDDSNTIEGLEVVVKPDLAGALPLMGKALPGFDGIKIALAADQAKDRMVLVCFFDMEQRPSRNCISQLAKQADRLKDKSVAVIAVQASQTDQGTFDEWIKKNSIPFPVGMVETDVEEIRFAWCVRSLPWLILTNRDHVVTAEGFAIGELSDKMSMVRPN
jgi:uncharacterized GH25 family protein